jgi:REP element-mobilizing transposase RayT
MKLGEQIKLLMFDIAKEKGFEIIEIQVDQIHIHLLASYKPVQSVLDIVRF